MEKSADQILNPEAYARRHKEAFRCAFDFLNAHFPPENTPEWWQQAVQDITDASVSQGENKLAVELLTGVFNYLDDERRIRRETGNQ